MKLGLYSGKLIRITDIDGQVFEGIGDYSSEDDNPEGIASICIDDIIIFENEIAGIEVISSGVPAAVTMRNKATLPARRIV